MLKRILPYDLCKLIETGRSRIDNPIMQRNVF